MIKVCHIVDSLGLGGLEKTVIGIASNLEGYEHQIWCLKNRGVLAPDIEGRKIKLREFNIEGGLKISSLAYLVREIKKERFDIIHSHGFYPSIWGLLAAIFTRGVKRIVHIQNTADKLRVRDKLKLRFLYCFATKIIAVSQAVKKSLVSSIGINPGKIEVIYNSATEIKAQDFQARCDIRRSLGFKEDDFIVGNIARIEEHKGHIFLVEAINKCIKRYPFCKCIIAGDGQALEHLKQTTKNLGFNDAIFYLGRVKDIERLLLVMDVFVQPSVLMEGLPLALAEAASAGLPIIGTNIGGIPEIVQEGANGFIISPRDSDAIAGKIIFLIENLKDKKRMGENSKKIWQDKFSLGKMIHQIDLLYKNSLSLER
jgi:glycosyltransferase involved in cell wall biosynthesis